MKKIKSTYKDKYKKFQDWQHTPYQVAPMSEEERVCATCRTEYKGNFCPRCGQSAKIESRMSAWKTLLLVLDVWGVGNRGMFRTLRDLILRPGYLICDYLQGRRSAYFPPFKLLFLLTTLSLLVGHGFNIFNENYQVSMNPVDLDKLEDDQDKGNPVLIGVSIWINTVINFQRDYPAIFQLCFICIGGYFLYLFFKNTKTLGKISFSEFIIALVYMACMFIMYNVFIRFFCYFGLDLIYWSWIPLLYFIPLKQLSGYSVWGTIWRSISGLILTILALCIILIIVLVLAVVIFHQS